MVIEYEPLKAYTVRRVIEEGIFRVDPRRYSEYVAQEADANVRIVDRIEDLPQPSEEIMRALQNYNQQTSADYDGIIPAEIARSLNMPIDRQERVLSPGVASSIPSPTIVPLQSEPGRSHDGPIELKSQDLY